MFESGIVAKHFVSAAIKCGNKHVTTFFYPFMDAPPIGQWHLPMSTIAIPHKRWATASYCLALLQKLNSPRLRNLVFLLDLFIVPKKVWTLFRENDGHFLLRLRQPWFQSAFLYSLISVYFLGGSWETQTMFFMSTQKCIAIGSEQNPGNTPGVLHRPRSDRPPFQLSVSFEAKLCRLTSWIVNRRQPCRCHPESRIFELIWPAYMTANKAWLSTKIGRRKPVVKRCPKKWLVTQTQCLVGLRDLPTMTRFHLAFTIFLSPIMDDVQIQMVWSEWISARCISPFIDPKRDAHGRVSLAPAVPWRSLRWPLG